MMYRFIEQIKQCIVALLQAKVRPGGQHRDAQRLRVTLRFIGLFYREPLTVTLERFGRHASKEIRR
ncbi:MAG TPA: hypothetical protein VKU00_01510 [Chthonomonadaceae bacterium]|nr:hypothetical protein [Chthonomonadaceae bacterium]